MYQNSSFVGSTFALAAAMFDIEVKVYMVRVSNGQNLYHCRLMETKGQKSCGARKPHPVGKS
jgi:predicted alternative tryptophan synthase beta-subunit